MTTALNQLYESLVQAAAAEAERRVMERIQLNALPDVTFTLQEAAQYLKMSESSLRQFCRERAIPHRKHGAPGSKNPRYLFSQASLDQWKRAEEERNYRKEAPT